MSKYPQVNLSHIDFDNRVTVSHGAVHMVLSKELSLSTDFLANKSIMGSLHSIDHSAYAFIFTTHVQALGSRMQKRRQYREIREFIEYAVHAVVESGTVDASENITVLLAGDFNSDAYDDKDLSRLLTNLGNPRDLHREVHTDRQEFTMQFKLFNFQKRFDYILAYDQIGEYKLKNIQAVKINVTDIRTDQNESISDHRALKGIISVDQTRLATKSNERLGK
jgi:endonuclease/exonuclease/phosphatase family metal-dependent hydrolase